MPEESTTPDLEERVQRFVDAINAQDFDAAVSIYAHDAILDTSVGIHRGRAAIRSFIEDWLGTYEQHHWKADEVRDVGNGVVFVVVCQRARLPDTRESLENRFGAVLIWVNGLIEEQTNRPDIDEARAAAERLAEERG